MDTANDLEIDQDNTKNNNMVIKSKFRKVLFKRSNKKSTAPSHNSQKLFNSSEVTMAMLKEKRKIHNIISTTSKKCKRSTSSKSFSKHDGMSIQLFSFCFKEYDNLISSNEGLDWKASKEEICKKIMVLNEQNKSLRIQLLSQRISTASNYRSL